MAYTKTNWVNGTTPVNATNLKHIENGIEALNPTILYSDTTGTTGTVSLSETAANFDCIEIFYRNTDSDFQSTKVYSPNEKKVNIMVTNTDGSTSVWLKCNRVTISGTSITVNNSVDWNITANAGGFGNSIYITKVIGYK